MDMHKKKKSKKKKKSSRKKQIGWMEIFVQYLKHIFRSLHTHYSRVYVFILEFICLNQGSEMWNYMQTPILWSHGMSDRTVLFEAGQAGPPFLEQAGLSCEFKVLTHPFLKKPIISMNFPE